MLTPQTTCSWSHPRENDLLCHTCHPDTEFWNSSSKECQMCTQYSTTMCEEIIPCCGNADTKCNHFLALPTNLSSSSRQGLCGNGVIDYDLQEECDWAQFNSTQTTRCCGPDCKLLPGYYNSLCETLCGDGILAGTEVCDEISPLCKNCQCIESISVYFDRNTQRCTRRIQSESWTLGKFAWWKSDACSDLYVFFWRLVSARKYKSCREKKINDFQNVKTGRDQNP